MTKRILRPALGLGDPQVLPRRPVAPRVVSAPQQPLSSLHSGQVSRWRQGLR